MVPLESVIISYCVQVTFPYISWFLFSSPLVFFSPLSAFSCSLILKMLYSYKHFSAPQSCAPNQTFTLVSEWAWSEAPGWWLPVSDRSQQEPVRSAASCRRLLNILVSLCSNSGRPHTSAPSKQELPPLEADSDLTVFSPPVNFSSVCSKDHFLVNPVTPLMQKWDEPITMCKTDLRGAWGWRI